MNIRWALRRDISSIISIEQKQFDIPWAEEDFVSHLREKDTIGLVVEINDIIVGYVVYELKPQYYEILNLAVHPEYLRQTIGTQLIDKLKGKMSINSRKRIIMHLSDANLGGHLFLQKCGFTATVLRNYYSDYKTDGYKFTYRLGQ